MIAAKLSDAGFSDVRSGPHLSRRGTLAGIRYDRNFAGTNASSELSAANFQRPQVRRKLRLWAPLLRFYATLAGIGAGCSSVNAARPSPIFQV